MYYTKAEAYQIFRKTEEDIENFEISFNKFADDAESMSPSSLKSGIKRLRRSMEKINLNNLDPYLEMQKGSVNSAELEERVNLSKSKMAEFENLLNDMDNSIFNEPAKDDSDDKIQSGISDIKNNFEFIKKQYGSSDMDTTISELKKLDREIGRLDFAELEEGDYDDMIQIRNDVASLKRNMIGVQKSEKYGPYLKTPIAELIDKYISLPPKKKEGRTAAFLDFIEDPANIEMWEPAIKRIIAKKMTAKEFRTFYDAIQTAMRGADTFESFEDYKIKNEKA